MLDWRESPELRRRCHAGLNKSEQRHALARVVCTFKQGRIADRGRDAQQFRASGLNLVIAAIVFWNSTYLADAVAYLRARGEAVPAAQPRAGPGRRMTGGARGRRTRSVPPSRCLASNRRSALFTSIELGGKEGGVSPARYIGTGVTMGGFLRRAVPALFAAMLAWPGAQVGPATAATPGGPAEHGRARHVEPERSAGTVVLAQAVTRDQVAEVQRRLNELGYDAGPADGLIGPKTRAAIRTFQEREGLRTDGELSPGLMARLEQAVAWLGMPEPTAEASHLAEEATGSPSSTTAAAPPPVYACDRLADNPDAVARGAYFEELNAEQAVEACRDERLRRFEAEVERVNERVRRAVGTEVFAAVEALGSAVALTATEVWHAAPEAARRANLKTLAEFWGALNGPGAPAVVRVVDRRGEVLMEGPRRAGADLAGADG